MKKQLALLLLIAFIIGCGSDGEQASVMMHIRTYAGVDSLVTHGYLEGYGFEMLPVATVNQETLRIWWNQHRPYYDGPLTNVTLGNQCDFKIDYGKGEAEASLVLPSEFNITNPDSGFILYQGNDLNITWDSASGSDWYWLYVDVRYEYLDTAGTPYFFDFQLDTILDNTTYTVAADHLFPDDYDTIYTSYGGLIEVQAVAGPRIEPGEEGNITGDAIGFFWCSHRPRNVQFSIEHQPVDFQDDFETLDRHFGIMRRFAAENE